MIILRKLYKNLQRVIFSPLIIISCLGRNIKHYVTSALYFTLDAQKCLFSIFRKYKPQDHQTTPLWTNRWSELFSNIPDRCCLIRPWLSAGSTGRKSLNQEISGSGSPLAAQSMVAVRVLSTTFSWGPMSILGKPNGSWSSTQWHKKNMVRTHAERVKC